jgi:hypothetical protein
MDHDIPKLDKKGLREFGYKKLITTPHIMSDFYRNTPEVILKGLDDVRSALKKEQIDVQLEAAAEYYCDMDFEKSIEKGNLMTFSGKFILASTTHFFNFYFTILSFSKFFHQRILVSYSVSRFYLLFSRFVYYCCQY